MSISLSAARKIQEMWNWYKGQRSTGAAFANPGMPIRLAKTTASHAIGVTQDVTLMWGPKGSEGEGTARQDTVPAFNRFTSDLAVDTEVHIARVGVGWEIIGRERSADSASCVACSTIPEADLVIDLGGGLLAADQYLLTGKCGGSAWLFSWDSGSTWTGTTVDATVDCDGSGTLTLTATMVVTNSAPGGVVIKFLDGATIVAQWENDPAWQPCTEVEVVLADYLKDCQCVAWRGKTCLVPVAAA